jgi:hypothetical protein
MANLIGTGTDQHAINGQLGSLAFQDHNGATLATTINQITNTTTARPSINLDFMNSQQMDSRLAFTRNTTATYVGSNGLIQTATYNQPRFEFDTVTGQCKGLLIEESRTNLWSSYADLGAGGAGVYNNWNAAPISTNTAVAPDGTTTADTFFATSPTATRAFTFSATAGTTYTFSMYVKRNPASNDAYLSQFGASIVWSNNGSSYTGYTSVSVNAQTLPQGVWTRVSTSYTCPTGAVSMQFGPSNGGGSGAGVGDQLYSIFVWGLQIEAGAYATSIIPTSGSQVTRSYDSVVMNQTNLQALLNPGFNSSMVGTVFSSFQPNNTVNRESDYLSFGGSSWLRVVNPTDIGAFMEINGIANPNFGGGPAGFSTNGVGSYLPSTGKFNNIAFSINYTDVSFVVNGVLGSQTSYIGNKPYYPYPTSMYVGSLLGGYTNLWANGWVRKIALYNTVLSDAELIEMTR